MIWSKRQAAWVSQKKGIGLLWIYLGSSGELPKIEIGEEKERGAKVWVMIHWWVHLLTQILAFLEFVVFFHNPHSSSNYSCCIFELFLHVLLPSTSALICHSLPRCSPKVRLNPQEILSFQLAKNTSPKTILRISNTSSQYVVRHTNKNCFLLVPFLVVLIEKCSSRYYYQLLVITKE